MRRFFIDIVVTGLLLFVLRTIFGVELEEYWNGTVQPHLDAHAWSWVATMLSFLPTFWGGAFVALLVLFLIDRLLALWPLFRPNEGGPKHLTAESDRTEIQDESIKRLSSENQALHDKVRELEEYRKSAARIVRLKQALVEIDDWTVRYLRHADRMDKYIAEGVFDPTEANPFEVWYAVIKKSIEAMDGIRGDFKRVMKDLLAEDFDFEATPSLTDNPHSVKPPNIDRLPRDEFKYAYKRSWERRLRADRVIKGLRKRLEIAIAQEERKIAGSGEP